MLFAYVDTSLVVAMKIAETLPDDVVEVVSSIPNLYSSYLLEAETRSTVARFKLDFQNHWLEGIRWISHHTSLTQEYETVLEAGYLRGADLWHVATALHLWKNPSEIGFFTLDLKQHEVARKLGFQVLQ